jgi:hypothetical protein
MKKILLLIFIVPLLQSCLSTQKSTRETSVWLDEQGKEVSEEKYRNKWGKDGGFARWDKVEDGKRIATLPKPIYERLQGSYQGLHTILENLSGKEYENNTTFLLDYVYKDDFCSSKYSNNWNKSTTKERKKFLDPQKKEIEKKYENVVILHLFQEGVTFKSSEDNCYFYTDTKNIILKNLFQEPAFCGSHAIIKPDGKILIRNGEYRLDWMAEFIEPENWNKIFNL